MAGPSGPVAERRIASHGDWKDNVLFACVAWLLFSFRLLATKLLSVPLYKTWLHTQTFSDWYVPRCWRCVFFV